MPFPQIKITTRYTGQTFIVHWPENKISTNHCYPEMDIAKCMVQITAKHFREPMINTCMHSKHRCHTHNNMEVCNNKFCIMQMNINSRVPKEQAGQSSGNK